MAHKFARCRNTDYCSLGDRRVVMRLDEDEPFFCPECAQRLVAAPPWDQRRMPWPALGAVAMAGVAVASGYLVAQRWPHAMSYVTARYFAAPTPKETPAGPREMMAATADAPGAAKLYLAVAMDEYLPRAAGDFVLRARRGRPPRIDPLAAAAVADLEAGVPPVPWPQDEEMRAAMPWRQALIMAALVSTGRPVSAAAPQVGIVAAPPADPTPPATAPTAGSARAPLAPVDPPEAAPSVQPQDSDTGRHGVRPQAAMYLPTPVAMQAVSSDVVQLGDMATLARLTPITRGKLTSAVGAVSEQIANVDETAPVFSGPRRIPQPPSATELADGLDIGGAIPDRVAALDDTTSLIVPVPDHVTPALARMAETKQPVKDNALASDRPTEVPPILRAPIAPRPIANSSAAAKSATPVRTQLAKAAAHKVDAKIRGAIAPVRVASSHIVEPSGHGATKIAKNEAKPKHSATRVTEAVQSHAPPVAAPPDAQHTDQTADAADTDTTPAEPATPHTKVVVVNSGFSMRYTPLNNVNLTSIVMPARPKADKPQMGSLKVDCVVETSGLPTDCRVVHAERAAAVSTALLAWMGSGLVHRAPTIQNGHPVRARQTWTLDFPSEARRTADASETDTDAP